MAAYIYDTTADRFEMTAKIRYIVRSNREEGHPDSTMPGFLNLLRFREVVPHLVRLLRAGGIWTMNCEAAYVALQKCRVEQVCQ